MVTKRKTIPIENRHSSGKCFTLRANFKTELSVPADSFESPTAMETFEIVSDRELFSELFALREGVRRFLKKIGNTKDGKKRKSLKAETWLKLAIKPEEIEYTPFDVMVGECYGRECGGKSR